MFSPRRLLGPLSSGLKYLIFPSDIGLGVLGNKRGAERKRYLTFLLLVDDRLCLKFAKLKETAWVIVSRTKKMCPRMTC